MLTKVLFTWQKFTTFQEALKKHKGIACLYVLTDKDENILRIGESGCLRSRYRGGTGWMVEAAMHGSGNIIFVAAAPVEQKMRQSAEALLTYRHQPPYCQRDKMIPPVVLLAIEHQGDVPRGLR